MFKLLLEAYSTCASTMGSSTFGNVDVAWNEGVADLAVLTWDEFVIATDYGSRSAKSKVGFPSG